jgi:ABC-type branched-subunit amino acid transport system ATPase component
MTGSLGATATPAVRVAALRAGYGAVEVLRGISAVFPANALTVIVGSNGSGKSTLLRCIAGDVPARAGTVHWNGVAVTSQSAHRRATSGIMLVPDGTGVFTTLTVRENLEVFGRPRPAAQSIEIATDWFPELSRLRHHRAGTLSGGERQMLALSRVAVTPWSAALLDEARRGLSTDVWSRFVLRLQGLVSPERVIAM